MKRELFILGALATGCAPYQAPPAATYEEALLQVDEDLEALESLELFEVGDMVVTNEMMPGACYGPCDDDPQREQAYVEQAGRLHALVALAEDASGEATMDDVDRALSALDALEVVEVGELLVTEPQTSGACYGPCPEELEEAERVNAERAAAVCELAERSAGL